MTSMFRPVTPAKECSSCITRRRSKKRRAGCLLCKPHKMNGSTKKNRDPVSARRRLQEKIEEVE